MDIKQFSLMKTYFSNLQVEVTLAGFNTVGNEWKDIDYIPEYNKLYYIVDGEGWLKIRDKEYEPKPGQLFLMPQGIKQSYSSTTENTFLKYWCHFTASVGDMNIFDILEVPDFIEIEKKNHLEECFKELVKYYNSPEVFSVFKVKSSILQLISFYLEHSAIENIKVTKSETITSINNAIDYIDKNYFKSISIKELAGIAHLNPQYFIRIFKKNLGISPIQYLNKRRIEEAKRMLTTTNFTLTEISDKLGYNNLYYLSKRFKQSTGLTPTEYKSFIK